jgi:class 3 adenylate cyclase
MSSMMLCPSPAGQPVIPVWNGFGQLDQVVSCLKRFASAQNALLHGRFPFAELGAERADWLDERPIEMARRRMAILIGDVTGYSRLIEIDDVGTVARLRFLRRELFDPTATLFHAVMIRHTADTTLLAFDNPMDAVGCAIMLQSVLFLLNEDKAEQGIRFRMGLSIGEVLLVDDEMHGMGVNIAARLEALAGPGEIYLCERVVNDIQHLLPPVFESLGACRLHNISTPIQTFRVGLEVIADIARPTRGPGIAATDCLAYA